MSYDAVILCDATCPMIGNDPAQYACTRAMGHVGRHLAVDRDDDIIIWKMRSGVGGFSSGIG